VKDVHRYGVLSFTDVIVKSSNVGAIKIGSRLGQERMGRYVARFGFGRRVCPDLRGESSGMVADPANWTLNSLASISMGYEIGVTPMQMIAAVSSVANGGRLIEPRLVRAFGTGASRRVVRPNELRRTIDPGTIAELTTIMELVVTEGTGKKAQVAGYTVAGKTGTAAKNFPGRGYSKTDYHASFVGFVPSRKPALAILVVVDTPRGPGYPTKHKYYGGDIAAPVFQRVAEQSLRYLAIPPTVNPMPPVIVADVTSDSTGAMTPATASAAAPQVDVVSGVPTIPELRGLGAREAIVRLAKQGLTPHVSGTGLVTAQDPPPGTPIDSRSTCTLRLGRPLAPPPGVPPQ
jgi:cell division protein FtsI (penicillin-binding protein 3)